MTAHQVPAVSQSAYSPSSPETPDSRFSTPPQTLLNNTGPPPPLMTPPPTQPTAKVHTHTHLIARVSHGLTLGVICFILSLYFIYI